jgi:tRNA threonylcarbamoyladenosine biosynthesis protein TsaE
MKRQVFLSKNAEETKKFAGQIAKEVLAQKKGKTASILALVGELGGGKTTFVQGLAGAIGIKERILSPTFVLLKRFAIVDTRFTDLYHIDCYRLDEPQELHGLELEKILANPNNLVVIEWADKIKSLIPKNAVWLEFEWVAEDKRNIYKT